MNIRYTKYGRREDPRHPFNNFLMQLAVIFLFAAGLSLTLFLLLLSAVFSPIAALVYWFRSRNGDPAINFGHTDNHASRKPGVIEGKYEVIDK
ncbi:MAG: hypothetical protein PVJ78_15090 [Gammaproteobacteria bacterium]|jgi:hypothetical protein